MSRHSTEKVNEVLDCIKAGLGIAETSRVTGIHANSVKAIFKRSGLETIANNAVTDQKRQQIVLLCNDGLSVSEVAKRIGVSKATVHKYRPHKQTSTKKILKFVVEELLELGKTTVEIMAHLECDLKAIQKYLPSNIKKWSPPTVKVLEDNSVNVIDAMLRKHRDKLVFKEYKHTTTEFPVHPEIQAAKEKLLSVYLSGTFDVTAVSKAQRDLAETLEQYYPRHVRPLEQLTEHPEVSEGLIIATK